MCGWMDGHVDGQTGGWTDGQTGSPKPRTRLTILGKLFNFFVPQLRHL